jgi:hypothetical protein
MNLFLKIFKKFIIKNKIFKYLYPSSGSVQIYNTISDKCVGNLLSARKHGFVSFEGEMLYQVTSSMPLGTFSSFSSFYLVAN